MRVGERIIVPGVSINFSSSSPILIFWRPNCPPCGRPPSRLSRDAMGLPAGRQAQAKIKIGLGRTTKYEQSFRHHSRF